MRIGLLSDTHGYLDPRLFEVFASCDEVWHAGDLGSLALARSLAAFKPLRAVHGNIDTAQVRSGYPEDQRFVCEGMDVWMTHITGRPPRWVPRVQHLLRRTPPGLLVGGHTHMLQVARTGTPAHWYLNPGAAGRHGIHRVRTALRFTIQQGRLSQMEVVELGPR